MQLQNTSSILIKNLSQIATPQGKKALRGSEMNEIKIYENAAIFIKDGIIREIGGNEYVCDCALRECPDVQIFDAEGKCAVPGFIDPHTHFLFAGERSEEFTDRLSGVPYMELLKRGGGICSTMEKTRAASKDELFRVGKSVLDSMLSYGVTTVEGKSGYGLDCDNEIKMLEVMKQLNEQCFCDVAITYLGAHAVPPEFKNNADEYVNLVIEMLSRVKDIAQFVDVFCETGVFTNEQAEKILTEAKKQGFELKLHADEMTSTNGAALACKLGAVSADHLLAVSDEDIYKLSKSETVAVLLPATAFCMRKNFAPARKMIDEGCAVALASDFNPGSCYTYNTAFILALAVISMNMTAREALSAITLNAAAAICRADTIGSLEIGKQGDVVILDCNDYRTLIYKTAINIVSNVVKGGKLCSLKK